MRPTTGENMNIDNFKQTFFNYSRIELQELYKASEIEGKFKVTLFNQNLSNAWRTAQMNGLSEIEFASIVQDIVTMDYDSIIFPFYEQTARAA